MQPAVEYTDRPVFVEGGRAVWHLWGRFIEPWWTLIAAAVMFGFAALYVVYPALLALRWIAPRPRIAYTWVEALLSAVSAIFVGGAMTQFDAPRYEPLLLAGIGVNLCASRLVRQRNQGRPTNGG